MKKIFCSAIIALLSFTNQELLSMQKTLSIIKPDATARNLVDVINAQIKGAGLEIIAQKCS